MGDLPFPEQKQGRSGLGDRGKRRGREGTGRRERRENCSQIAKLIN